LVDWPLQGSFLDFGERIDQLHVATIVGLVDADQGTPRVPSFAQRPCRIVQRQHERSFRARGCRAVHVERRVLIDAGEDLRLVVVGQDLRHAGSF